MNMFKSSSTGAACFAVFLGLERKCGKNPAWTVQRGCSPGPRRLGSLCLVRGSQANWTGEGP